MYTRGQCVDELKDIRVRTSIHISLLTQTRTCILQGLQGSWDHRPAYIAEFAHDCMSISERKPRYSHTKMCVCVCVCVCINTCTYVCIQAHSLLVCSCAFRHARARTLTPSLTNTAMQRLLLWNTQITPKFLEYCERHDIKRSAEDTL